MRPTMLRKLLIALMILPVLGGMSLRAMPSEFAAGRAMDCVNMTMSGQGKAAGKSVPCKTNSTDCLKQMACFGAVVLPAPSGEHVTISYTTASYWPSESVGTGRSLTPEPFPPIAS